MDAAAGPPSYLASHLTMGTSAPSPSLSKPWFSPYQFPSGAPGWMPVESRTARKIGKLRLRTAHGQRTWDPTQAAEDEGRQERGRQATKLRNITKKTRGWR